MTKLIELVEQKDADGFKTAVEERLAEKVSEVLDALKPMVAAKYFSNIGEDAEGSESGELSDKTCNISNEGEPGPGVGQAPDQKGGLSNVQKGGKSGMPKVTKDQGLPESFKAVEAAARKSGASNPKAVAAAVGFKKYGKRRMEKAAHEGKPAKDVK